MGSDLRASCAATAPGSSEMRIVCVFRTDTFEALALYGSCCCATWDGSWTFVMVAPTVLIVEPADGTLWTVLFPKGCFRALPRPVIEIAVDSEPFQRSVVDDEVVVQ